MKRQSHEAIAQFIREKLTDALNDAFKDAIIKFTDAGASGYSVDDYTGGALVEISSIVAKDVKNLQAKLTEEERDYLKDLSSQLERFRHAHNFLCDTLQDAPEGFDVSEVVENVTFEDTIEDMNISSWVASSIESIKRLTDEA